MSARHALSPTAGEARRRVHDAVRPHVSRYVQRLARERRKAERNKSTAEIRRMASARRLKRNNTLVLDAVRAAFQDAIDECCGE